MSDTLSGPSFDTGSGNWNSALGNLAHALFPDPMRQGRAYYYGTEARKAQAETDKMSSQAAAEAYNIMMARNSAGAMQPPAEPSFRPGALPGFGPVLNAPSNTPGLYAPPGALAQVVGPGNAPFPKGVGTTGTPPPAASPAPNSGAPPAPNTTASNGTVPNDNQGDGTLNYNAINTTGGGQQYAPAAAANGSPAPVPFNLPTIVAMAHAAGYDAASIQRAGEAYIANAFQSDALPWRTATQLAGLTGNNAPYESDQGTLRTRITEGGATQREGMRLAQAESQFQRTPQQILTTTDAQGNPITRTPGAPGQGPQSVGPQFNQPLEEQRREPFTAGGGGRFGTGPQVSTKGQAPGQPGYSAENDRQMNTPVRYVKPDGTTDTMLYGDYLKTHPGPLTPESVDAVRAAAITAGLSGNQQAPTQFRRGAAASTVPGATTGEEALITDEVLKQHAAIRYAPSDHPLDNKLPGRFDADAAASVRARAAELMRDPNAGPAYNNVGIATDQAIKELVDAGVLPAEQDRTKVFAGLSNPNVRQSVDRGKASGVFIVPIQPGHTAYRPGAIGPAPKGAKEGKTFRDPSTGQTAKVENGFLYPQ